MRGDLVNFKAIHKQCRGGDSEVSLNPALRIFEPLAFILGLRLTVRLWTKNLAVSTLKLTDNKPTDRTTTTSRKRHENKTEI